MCFDLHRDSGREGCSVSSTRAADQLRQIGGPSLRRDDPALQPVEIEQVRRAVARACGRSRRSGRPGRARPPAAARSRDCSSVSAEPRIDVSGVRRSCETASRNVFFISSSARSRCAASRSRRNASLYLRSLRGRACSARLRSVMSTIRPRSCCAAPGPRHHVHHVADPHRAAVGRLHPVLEAPILARHRRLRGSQRPPRRSSSTMCSPQRRPWRPTMPSRRAEQLLGPASDEREPERVRVGLPEDGVEARHQLVEPLQLGETARVAECERGDVGDPAGQPEVLIGEPIASGSRRPITSAPKPSGSQRSGATSASPGLTRRSELAGTVGDDLARDHERLGPIEAGTRWRSPRDAAIAAGASGDRSVTDATSCSRRKSPVSSSRRYASRRTHDQVGAVSIASPQDVARPCGAGQGLGQAQERRRGLGGLALGLEAASRSGSRRRHATRVPRAAAGPPRRTSRSRASTARSRPSKLSPTAIGTASIDSRTSSVPGICTANSTSRASGVSSDLRVAATYPVMPSPTSVISYSTVSFS